MGRTKHRLSSQLGWVLLAYALVVLPLVSSLPSNERKTDEAVFEAVELPVDVATRAPLMRRATERGEVAQARYMRQAQAAAVFEASRFAARTLREQQGRKGRPLSPLGGLPDRGDRAGLHHFQRRKSTSSSSSIMSKFPASLAVADENTSTYPRNYHLSEKHGKCSPGGPSEHWLDQPGLKSNSFHRSHHFYKRHHHHHHSRQAAKDSSPSRLPQTKEATIEGNVTVTLIAPPSVHPTGRSFRVGEDQGTSQLGRLKRRSIRRAERWVGLHERGIMPNSPSESSEEYDGLRKRGIPKIGDGTSPGIPGIIDLVQNSCDGEKLGGLSVSRFLADDRNISDSSSILLLLIDSTPNLVDQATFFVRPFEDHSVLEYDHPSVGTSKDLLVALEVPSAPNNSWLKKLCATFDPLDSAIQTFGLALCMNQGSAINNRRMSQAFRYSPHNGILAPYYGAEETKEAVLTAVNERIQAMESDDGNRTSVMSGWNGTGVYDPDPNALGPASNSTTLSMSNYEFNPLHTPDDSNSSYGSSRLEPFSTTYPTPGTPKTVWSSVSVAATAPIPTPILAINDTSVHNHPLVIGEHMDEPVSAASSGTSTSIIMVFRPMAEPQSWRRTKQDIDTPAEREKALAGYQEIGLASKDSVELSHWTIIDKLSSSETSGTSRPAVACDRYGNVEKSGTPVKYGSDIGASKSSAYDLTDSSGETGTSTNPDEANDSLPPKPVLNVAYFGDSGRSAPVPPEEQADFARPILVADPLPEDRTTSEFPSTHLEASQKSEEDVSTTLRDSPSDYGLSSKGSPPGVMATIPKGQFGPLGIPIDASD
ncbi:unnamed protein product [Rhizoctonia solani]|uniref:Uncharacterized protein n=1 Tax=Rhizoctonia solani TaxID=456999 RepID=A0A8H3CIN7_9AGAM|nr:unnamed protein product [Rhizoctonia solani]